MSRLDWPPVASVTIGDPAVRIRQQQQALTDKLDKLQSLGINTVFFQVKPDGTALWPSKILPLVRYADRPYRPRIRATTPLQFMLDEAHKRGMRVHAWFNPYRVSVNTRPKTVSELNGTLSQIPASVFVLHRDWIRTAGDRLCPRPGDSGSARLDNQYRCRSGGTLPG
ncbi:Uncharacterized protein conserved in bacteria [Raoultella planticola]|uniref:Uncharacterized protein conserved in bacteria n=1 Tax=Raoultella planticola TaxID=575 RepID=A0A485CWS9_RAOPL|nr:Uncharacterized protein conserved in bacteria [Raoultella planticola]